MKKSLKLSVMMSLSTIATLGIFSHKAQAEEVSSPEVAPTENVETLDSETEPITISEEEADESIVAEEMLEENLSDSMTSHIPDEVMPSQVTPTYIRPVDTGVITAGWDSPWHRANGYGEHTGIDFDATHGTPVRAVRSGVIEYEGWGKDHPRKWLGATAGIYALIRHEDGTYAGYAHLSNTVVNKGQQVRQGEIIGHVGGSGTTLNTFAPHLHFEMFPENPNFGNGRAGRIDPTQYVANAPVYEEHTPVVTTTEETMTYAIPKGEAIKIDDPSLEKGKQVYIAGHDGTRQVVERITFTDGSETKREVLSDTVLTEPQADIIKMGTKVIEAVPKAPITEAPKPEASPKPEAKPEIPSQPKPQELKPEAEAPAPTTDSKPQESKSEGEKPMLPNTGTVEHTPQSKEKNIEGMRPSVSTAQGTDKQLPQTGEVNSFTIFGAATLAILAGVGMLPYSKREDI